MAMILRWRHVPPAIVTQWRGPDGTLAPSALSVPPRPLAAIIGPPGPTGPAPPSGVVTLTINDPAGRMEHQQQVAAPGITATSVLFCALAQTVDSDENDPELSDVAVLSALPGTNSMTVTATFSAPMSGPLKINWSAF